METLVSLPLVIPPVATGLILLKLLGRRGIVGHFLHDTLHLDIVFTWRGVLVRSARIALENVNPRFEQIASTLGTSRTRVFFTITLPLASRRILGGVILAFARALGEFGATILVAGNIPARTSTLSLSIYQSVQMGNDAHALRLLGVSVLLAFIAVGTSEWLLRRRGSAR